MKSAFTLAALVSSLLLTVTHGFMGTAKPSLTTRARFATQKRTRSIKRLLAEDILGKASVSWKFAGIASDSPARPQKMDVSEFLVMKGSLVCRPMPGFSCDEKTGDSLALGHATSQAQDIIDAANGVRPIPNLDLRMTGDAKTMESVLPRRTIAIKYAAPMKCLPAPNPLNRAATTRLVTPFRSQSTFVFAGLPMTCTLVEVRKNSKHSTLRTFLTNRTM